MAGREIRDLRRGRQPPGWREEDAGSQPGNAPIGAGHGRLTGANRQRCGYRGEQQMNAAGGGRRLVLFCNIGRLTRRASGPGTFRVADRRIKPRRGKGRPRIEGALMMVTVVDVSVAGINPELHERMRVRHFGPGPVIGGQEQETE